MALTLDATLLAAQTATSRHPICELTVGKSVNDIPFPDNSGAMPQGSAQSNPTSLVLASGEIALFYSGPGTASANGGLWMALSDSERTTFSTQSCISSEYASSMLGMDCAEIESGNIGVVAWYGPSWECSLIAYSVSPSGTVLHRSVIWNYGGSAIIKGATVTYNGINYAVVYVKSDNSIAKRTSADFVTWSAEEVIYAAA